MRGRQMELGCCPDMKVTFFILRFVAFAFGLGVALPAFAQEPPVDWCGSPLSVQADPGTALVWRLRCTVQILNRERTEAADHATYVEIYKAMAEAQLKEALNEAAELKKAKEAEEHKNVPAPPAAVLPPHKDK